MSVAAVEHTKPVVVEVPEAVAAAFHALDDEVPALGAAVGQPAVEVVQDLARPTAKGSGEALEFADAAGGEDVEPVIEERFGACAGGGGGRRRGCLLCRPRRRGAARSDPPPG